MTQGFVSNYNDSGYTTNPGGVSYVVSTGGTSWTFPAQGNPYNVGGADIYTSGLRSIVGVYLIDGGYQDDCSIYPIYCSAKNINELGAPTDKDDAWLVYPGFGIQLFFDPNYTGEYSYLTYNLSTQPIIFACGNSSFVGKSNNVTLYSQSQNIPYDNNQTNSVKIYYRNSEILLEGLTPG